MKNEIAGYGHCPLGGVYLTHVQERLFSESRSFDAYAVHEEKGILGKVWNNGCGGRHEFTSEDPAMEKFFADWCAAQFPAGKTDKFYDPLDRAVDALLDLHAWAAYVRSHALDPIPGGLVFIRVMVSRATVRPARYKFYALQRRGLVEQDYKPLEELVRVNKIRHMDSPVVTGMEENSCLIPVWMRVSPAAV